MSTKIQLLDAEARAMEHGERFEIPTFDVRYMINVGDVVKLGFIVPDDHPARKQGCEAERMWVQVTAVEGVCGLVGKLSSQPCVLEGILKEGDEIKFWARHIMDMEDAPYHGYRRRPGAAAK